MQINDTFEECVGQESVKKTLSLYIAAYKETNRLPFLNLTTQKGGGKTFFARKFREALKRKDGTRPPMLEINGKTIKGVEQFFEQVYPVWVANDAFLFIDEGHNLPQALQQVFLTILNVDKNPNRTIELNGIPYDFDFEKISFAMATTAYGTFRLRNINQVNYLRSSKTILNIKLRLAQKQRMRSFLLLEVIHGML